MYVNEIRKINSVLFLAISSVCIHINARAKSDNNKYVCEWQVRASNLCSLLGFYFFACFIYDLRMCFFLFPFFSAPSAITRHTYTAQLNFEFASSHFSPYTINIRSFACSYFYSNSTETKFRVANWLSSNIFESLSFLGNIFRSQFTLMFSM